MVVLSLFLVAQFLLTDPGSAASFFGPNLRVDGDSGQSEQRRVAAVADDSGIVYAAWQDGRNGDWDIHFAKSSDGGSTFAPAVRLGGDRAVGTIQERPSIAMTSNGEIVVAWQDDRVAYADFDIFASMSSDRGGTFTAPVRVSDGDPGTIQMSPSVALDGLGRVFVAWQDFRTGNGDIRGAWAFLSSFSFGASVRVDDDAGTTATQSSPSAVGTSLGRIHVAYHDNRTGNANVYLATSAIGATTFGASSRVDDTGTAGSAQGLVSLAVDSVGVLYVAWQDDRGGDFDIYFAKSADAGRTFSPNVRAADGQSGAIQRSPRIAVGAARTVYLAWEDERNIDSDVYFTYSTNGGASFASPIRVDDAPDSTTDPAYQYGPVVVESKAGLVAVLWQDGRTDNGDIFAAKGYLAVGAVLVVDARLDPATITAGNSATVTVRVTSNGTGVDGATLTLSADVSGSFGSVSPLGSGTYAATFTPDVTFPQGGGIKYLAVTASASKSGYLPGTGQGVLQVIPGLEVSITAASDRIALGQRLDLTVTTKSNGAFISAASMFAAASRGGSLKPTEGASDVAGKWTTVFEPLLSAAGTTVTVSVSATKEGYGPGSAQIRVTVLDEAYPLEIAFATDRREMMSNEVARFTVILRSSGDPVPAATLSPYCAKGGTFSAIMDYGNGTYTFSFAAPYTARQSWLSVAVFVSKPAYENVVSKVPILLDPNMTNPSWPTPMFLLGEPESSYVPSGSTTKVLVYLYTKEGYVISGATVTVSLLNPAHGVLGPVKDLLNGLYTFTFTAGTFSAETGTLVRIVASKYGYQTASGKVGLLISP